MQSGPKNPLQQPRFCKRQSMREHPGHANSHTGCFGFLVSSLEHSGGWTLQWRLLNHQDVGQGWEQSPRKMLA